MDDRVKTGITGLDDLIQGGLKSGSVTLFSGPAGSLKTIMASQFIYNGAKKFDEVCAYVTLEESVDNIRESLNTFKMDTKELEAAGKLHILDLGTMRKIKPEFGEEQEIPTMKEIANTLKTLTKKSDLKRVAIDSVSILGLLSEGSSEMRDDLFILTDKLRELGITTVLLTEIEEEHRDTKVSRFGIEEFLADGVIVLGFTRSKGEFKRWLYVRKMRFTDHNVDLHPVRVTDKGVEVISAEKIY